jgi:hypothetical protein
MIYIFGFDEFSNLNQTIIDRKGEGEEMSWKRRRKGGGEREERECATNKMN